MIDCYLFEIRIEQSKYEFSDEDDFFLAENGGLPLLGVPGVIYLQQRLGYW